MKYRDLVKRLTDAGWVVTKETPHDKAVHPERPGVKIPIPHHKEITAPPPKTAARQSMPFPPSAARSFLDLPPVSLRNLHLHLTKNANACRPPYLGGVAYEYLARAILRQAGLQ